MGICHSFLLGIEIELEYGFLSENLINCVGCLLTFIVTAIVIFGFEHIEVLFLLF